MLFIATRDGRDCGVQHAQDMGLGSNLCKKRGLLVPSEVPRLFTSFAEMNRMMTRTQEAYAKLKGSLVDELPRLRHLLGASSSFGHRKVIRRGGKLVEYLEKNVKGQPRAH